MAKTYPPELIDPIKSVWGEPKKHSDEIRPPLPTDDALLDLLNFAYHTSLLREEGRKLAFRIMVLPKEKAEGRGNYRRNSRFAEFLDERPLTVAELRRLAPAADSIRSMICVYYEEECGWKVWGVLDTGENWWQFTRYESSSGTPPPPNLCIGSPGPGELTISSAGFVLLSLRSGNVYFPRGSAFWSGPVSDYLESSRQALYTDSIRRLNVKKWDKKGRDNNYPKSFHDMCLSRILSGISEIGHGGTVLMVPDELSSCDSRLTDRVNIKHPCNYDYLWELMITHLELHRKYYELHFPLWDSESPINVDDYQKISIIEMDRARNDDDLSDCVRFIASLSSVDGALVVTDRFRVLGFGAEVIAQSPTLKHVQLAANPEATELKQISIESYGTRHRSAFRFCSSYEGAAAFIVSSDGGVKATMRMGSHVILWPEVQATYWGF